MFFSLSFFLSFFLYYNILFARLETVAIVKKRKKGKKEKKGYRLSSWKAQTFGVMNTIV